MERIVSVPVIPSLSEEEVTAVCGQPGCLILLPKWKVEGREAGGEVGKLFPVFLSRWQRHLFFSIIFLEMYIFWAFISFNIYFKKSSVDKNASELSFGNETTQLNSVYLT